jgi:hypothetical protein
MITELELNFLLPMASSWVEEQESYILKNGVPLNQTIFYESQKLGIKGIKNVRILVVDEIPLPTNDILKNATTRLGFIGKDTIGIAFRYGIYVKKFHQNDEKLLIHELTHTMQYERAGGVSPFLRQYVQECIEFGYPNGFLEQEAINFANKIYP